MNDKIPHVIEHNWTWFQTVANVKLKRYGLLFSYRKLYKCLAKYVVKSGDTSLNQSQPCFQMTLPLCFTLAAFTSWLFTGKVHSGFQKGIQKSGRKTHLKYAIFLFESFLRYQFLSFNSGLQALLDVFLSQIQWLQFHDYSNTYWQNNVKI